MELSNHARIRLRQRGYRPDDLELVERYGTFTGDGFYLRHKDAEAAISERKREIEALQRLEGTYLPQAGEVIVTVQRARRWKERRILRRSDLSGPRSSQR